MLMSGHVIGHVIRLLIDSGRGLSNGCVRLLQWLVWWCIQILNCTTLYTTFFFRNAEFGIQNSEFRIRNSEFRIRNSE